MISVLISMFDEEITVNATVKEVLSVFPDAHIFVVQSDPGAGTVAQGRMVVPNLAGTTKRYELAARAISRNMSLCFQNAKPGSEFIVALTGDTLVTDATNFTRRWEDMRRGGKVLACSQAIGQNFHAVTANPEEGRCGGRLQMYGISDFMPQFFIVDGAFAGLTGVFKEIQVTNPYTSEQCLGDEFMRHAKGKFRDRAVVFCDNAYGYQDGIVYHSKGVK